MKIEHWKCQSHYPDEQLNYRNLLGACRGGEKSPPHLQYCDTKKADRDLKWNPADPHHYIERRLRYNADGSVRSDDAEFNDQIEEVLNLNIAILKNNRKEVFNAVLQWWSIKTDQRQGQISRNQIERKRDWWVDQTELKPYCQVAIWLLDQYLAKQLT